MSAFRIKIGVAVFLVMSVVTGALYFTIVPPMAKDAERRVVAAVMQSAGAVQRFQRLPAYELTVLAQTMSLDKEIVKGVLIGDEKQRRVFVYDALSQANEKLKNENRKPDFFGVLDATGSIIARDLDPNDMYGDKMPYEAVQRALKGIASSDVWFVRNRMMRAACAPIVSDGKVIGAVAVAYDFTAASARDERKYLGADVAYYLDNTIRASSLVLANDENTEDAGLVAALNTTVFKEGGEASGAVAARKTSDVLDLTIQGNLYKAIVAPLPDAVSVYGLDTARTGNGATGSEHVVSVQKYNAGVVVLAAMNDALMPVKQIRKVIFGLGALLLLIVFGVMILVARHFVNAEDKLELGVNEIINGNTEYTFDTLEEFEGLANALNVMMAKLLGRPEPDAEGGAEGDESWRADVVTFEELESNPSSELVQRLTAEGEDQYYQRTYEEYCEARKRLNLSIEGLTQTQLSQKLRANEAMLKAKHKAQQIRFVVSSAGGKVSLKPILLS